MGCHLRPKPNEQRRMGRKFENMAQGRQNLLAMEAHSELGVCGKSCWVHVRQRLDKMLEKRRQVSSTKLLTWSCQPWGCPREASQIVQWWTWVRKILRPMYGIWIKRVRSGGWGVAKQSARRFGSLSSDKGNDHGTKKKANRWKTYRCYKSLFKNIFNKYTV